MTPPVSQPVAPDRAAWLADLANQFKRYNVAVPRPEEVFAYLAEHRELADLLPAICARARQEFPEPAGLAIVVTHDPEIPDSHLTLRVRPPANDPQILDRLDRLWRPDEDRLAAASGFLLITTDFRPPDCTHGF